MRLKHILLSLPIILFSVNSDAIDNRTLADMIQKEEGASGARIGVAMIDSNTKTVVSYRGDERFPFNSTHKVISCAALLHDVDQGKVTLTETVAFTKADLLEYSPVTEKFVVPKNMSFQQLCRAAIEMSDNTADNLILKKLGGIASFNAFLRSQGDNTTHLDRFEPDLNEAVPGDQRDTTTPKAMSQSIARLLLGNTLSSASRAQLTEWMINDQVANDVLRSVLPAGWRIADKTGTGGYGSRGIVAVVWPQQQNPQVMVIYLAETTLSIQQRNQVIARIGKAIFTQLAAEK